MKKFKRTIAFALAMAMMLALTACGGGASSAPAASSAAPAASQSEAAPSGEVDYTQGDPITIKYCTTTAETVPSGHFGKTMAARLDELTGGRIKVEVYFNSEMGNASELLEGLQLGTVEMTVSTSANLGGFTEACLLYTSRCV